MDAQPSGNFQVRMGSARKKRWTETCEARMVGENAAICKLADWWMSLDPVMQSMVIGQLPPADDLNELVLERLKSPRYPGPDENPFGHKGQHGESLTDEAMKATQGKGAAPPRDQSSKPPHKRGKH